jgi:WD40 repeat protein
MQEEANQGVDLLSLMARSWQLGEVVQSTCFDFNNRTVAFLTKSGAVFLAPISDPDPVSKRTRIQADTSRITISPRSEKIKPLTQVAVREGGVISIKPASGGGFVATVTNGPLLHIESDGSSRELGREAFDAPRAIATNNQVKQIAVLRDEEIVILTPDGHKAASVPLEGKSQDLAFSPDGTRLATCADDGVTLWRIGDTPTRDRQLKNAARYQHLSWSPTGRFITTALADRGLCTWRLADGLLIPMTEYPAPSHHFNWGPNDAFLVTSGAYRIICWPLSDADLEDADPTPLETGMTGVVLVTAAAAQNKRDLVAAGFANGIVVVCQAGKSDELVVRGPGGGSVTSLDWTGNGMGLAIGTDDGFAALITFPDFMFK